MRTYIALTTTNYQQNGYKEIVRGNNKEAVRNEAEIKIVGGQVNQVKDIYTQTELRNLIVVSKTKAKKLGVDVDNQDYELDI